MSVPRDEFSRAFVAVSYWLERRGAELTQGLSEPSAAATELVRRLSHPDRQIRAQLLAVEIARIGAALSARRLT